MEVEVFTEGRDGHDGSAGSFGEVPSTAAGEQRHQAVRKEGVPENIRMVDMIFHQREIRDSLSPEPAVTQGRIGKRDVMFVGKQAQAFHVGPGIFVNIVLAGQPHPIRADIVRRENHPFGPRFLEVLKK